MENRKKNFFYYIRKIFQPFNTLRIIIINILFWGLLLLLLVSFFSAESVSLQGDHSAMVLDIEGTVVEELSGTTLDQAFRTVNGYVKSETLLWDILESIEYARTDSRINAIYLDLRYMESAGMAALTEIRNALVRFREEGKTIIAYSDYYDQLNYYLASAADEIYADPLGDFFIRGFSVYNWYYGEGLERLGIDVNYFHAGKYKSYGEVYTRSSMSDEAREANRKWSTDLWNHYVETVSAGRSMKPEKFNLFINDYVRLLNEAGGNSVRAALRASFLDGLMERSEIQDRMIDLCGYSLAYSSFNQIYFDELLTLKGDVFPADRDKVAVISASGTIYNGYEQPGNIGSETLTELIETVQFDNAYKALVLRIDSGGGSAFASEIVRRKLQQLRDAGIPVVISMGSVAASGGYWITTASDQIWAQPTTITGSIGVFSLMTTYQDPLQEYLGVNVDGLGTTWLAGSMRSDRKLDPRVGEIIQQSVDFIYRQFLGYVSLNRNMAIDDVDAVAQGRVWSGLQARELGLVDELGGLDQAVQSAAALAGLKDDEYSTEFIRQEIPLANQLLTAILENSALSKLTGKLISLWNPLFGNQVLKKLGDLEGLNDPSGVYALTELNFK
ncbi:MAG: signal peptide peptidase SppA [Spirochaetales bacterium]|nr:signal peptide peptidase SppA [Spirochaetales bacterium]